MNKKYTWIRALPSVGAGINIETLIVYPALDKGGYDLEAGTHLDDVDEEFFKMITYGDTLLLPLYVVSYIKNIIDDFIDNDRRGGTVN